MMKRPDPACPRLAAAAVAAALILGAAPASRAEDGGPRDAVRATVVALVSTLEREREVVRTDDTRGYRLVDEAIAPRMDFERAARLILGRHWRSATPDQRHRFIDEFRRMMVRTYTTVIVEFVDTTLAKAPAGARATDLLDETIDYAESPAADHDGESTVHTNVVRSAGPPIGVDYRLHRRDGRWLVWDISVDGVSVVMTYRSSFRSIVRTDGLEGLIARMAEKNGQTGI